MSDTPTCFHCGAPIDQPGRWSARIEGVERPMCCAGCQAVAGAIVSAGLGDYYRTYPEYGRDLNLTFGEIGLAGHWMKSLLHYTFIYQAKMKPGWQLLPD